MIDPVRSPMKYQLIQPLSASNYSKVFKGRDRENGLLVAIKMQRSDRPRQMANHVMREIAAIKSIDCPQIISVLGCFWVDDFTYAMVFPLYRCDLKSHLGAPLALHEIRRIAKELACALYRLHLKGFVHRDIKPSNILIGHCGEVVLTDFGTVKCGRIQDRCLTGYLTTLEYRSPESFTGLMQNVYYEVDIWGFGCVLGEMVVNKPLFRNIQQKEHLQLGIILSKTRVESVLEFEGPLMPSESFDLSLLPECGINLVNVIL